MNRLIAFASINCNFVIAIPGNHLFIYLYIYLFIIKHLYDVYYLFILCETYLQTYIRIDGRTYTQKRRDAIAILQHIIYMLSH